MFATLIASNKDVKLYHQSYMYPRYAWRTVLTSLCPFCQCSLSREKVSIVFIIWFNYYVLYLHIELNPLDTLFDALNNQITYILESWEKNRCTIKTDLILSFSIGLNTVFLGNYLCINSDSSLTNWIKSKGLDEKFVSDLPEFIHT